jgi:hypothetical protein
MAWHLLLGRLTPGYRAEDDAGLIDRVHTILAAMG